MKTSNNIQWGENVIIVDADYVDKVAFNLIVNFERMIGRHIPKADMATWVECITLDGGCPRTAETGTEALTHVVLIHNKRETEMNNFNPSVYGDNCQASDTDEAISENCLLNGRAFKGETGECEFITVSADPDQPSMTKQDIIADVLAAMADEPQVKRVMIIPDFDSAASGPDHTYEILLPILRHLDRACLDKRVTAFAMQPLTSMPCRTEILGYSLMAALGIRADELKAE